LRFELLGAAETAPRERRRSAPKAARGKKQAGKAKRETGRKTDKNRAGEAKKGKSRKR